MMCILADAIETFVDEQKRIMVIPKDLSSESKKNVKEGHKRVEELIKLLRKGNKSVFKDPDDWNSID